MYTYLAGATGMTSAFPPSLQDGGFGKLWQRLHEPATRKQMIRAMNTDATEWASPDRSSSSAISMPNCQSITSK